MKTHTVKAQKIITRDGSAFINDFQLFDGTDCFWHLSVRSIFEAVLRRVRFGTPILCRLYPEGAGVFLCECNCGQLSILEGNCEDEKPWNCYHHEIMAPTFVEGFVEGMERFVRSRKSSSKLWLNYTPGFRHYILGAIADYRLAVIEADGKRSQDALMR